MLPESTVGRPPQRSVWLERAAGAAVLLALVGLVLWSYLGKGVVWGILSPELDGESRSEAVRSAFLSYGPLAPIAYLAFVVVEVVVAPIPGTMLYLPGGVIFGGFLGGTLSLAGNVLGAGIACRLMRVVVGRAFLERFVARNELDRVRALVEKRGLWIIVLLRVNPLTSSDLVSYASGLTRIRVLTVMLGTLIGMAPLCYAQAYLAEGLLVAFPWLVWPLVVAFILYAAALAGVVISLRRR